VDHCAIFYGSFNKGLVEWDTPDREARGCDDPLPYLDHVPPGRELHEGVCPGTLRLAGFLHLHLEIHDIGRGTDRGVHLGAKPFSDPADLHFPVGRYGDHDVPSGNTPPDEFLGHPFLPGHLLHLIGDDAGPGIFNKTHGYFFEERQDKWLFF